MSYLKVIIAFTVIAANASFARILNVPRDYPTIQAAIDAASSSDTVLVAEGTYYENINFKGKNIVVTSRFYITRDIQTIINTVINGSKAASAEAASCVALISKEDSTAILQGFTITGGTGSKYVFTPTSLYQEGGGVILSYSSAVIKNNIIKDNKTIAPAGVKNGGGGGIASMYGNPTICNNVIYSNNAGYASGIVLNWSGGKIRNNIIYHNTGADSYGSGGVMIWLPPKNSVFVENNVIAGNLSNSTYGGMEIKVDNTTINPVIRNNIIWGNRQKTGKQISNPQYTFMNNTEESYNSQNISVYPAFEEKTFALTSQSPCIDAGDTASFYYDLPDPANGLKAMNPAKGTLRNDLGAFGGKYAGLLPSINIQDLYIAGTSASVQCKASQEAQVKFEILNLSSVSLSLDSIRHTNNTEFSLRAISNPLAVLQKDSLTVVFKPKTAGNYSDTVKIFHKLEAYPNPIKLVVQGKAEPASAVEIQKSPAQSMNYQLMPCYPNPFNPSTSIRFHIPGQSAVSLKIYNMLGREIECLLNEDLSVGTYNVKWTPGTNAGSGVYLYYLAAGNFTGTGKMIYQK